MSTPAGMKRSKTSTDNVALMPTSGVTGPGAASRAKKSEVELGSDSQYRDDGSNKNRSKKGLCIFLGILSLAVIGAVIAIAVVLSGKNKDKAADGTSSGSSLTNRQKKLDDVISKLSPQGTLVDANSPQGQARKWLLGDDPLVLNPDDGISEQRVVQRYSLAVFYFATGGPTTWKPNDWLQGDECAGNYWDGVDCNDQNEVVTLAFEQQGLVGTIPDEVGQLSMLENFILKNNTGVHGKIPSTLGKLAALQQLGLYYSQLTGSLPSEIFEATTLRYINLRNNSLTGQLSSDVGKLKELETLILMNNKLEGQVPFDSLAPTSLKFLGLSSNMFSGALMPAIGNYKYLQYLLLDNNNFAGELPQTLGDAPNLKTINLDRNTIAGNMPTGLGKLVQLEFLSMQHNNLDGSLPTELRQMVALRSVNLGSNKLSGSIPDISTLKYLKNLVLSENQLLGNISESLLSLPALETLFLSSNKFGGNVPSANKVPLGGFKLRGLYLSDNKLQGSIPDSICAFKNLEALFLDENQLSGSIPTCIKQLSKLQQLYLFNNNLTGQLPAELGILRKLMGIGLEHNKFTGAVPQAVCDRALTDPAVDIWSDCGGSVPSVTCSCCSVCCPSANCV